MDEFTDRHVRAHDRPRDLVPDDIWDEALQRLQAHLRADARVIEVGVGTGAYAGRLAERGAQVIGFDLDETMLRAAARRWSGLRSRLAIGNASDAPVRSGSADCVLIAQVLHLVPKWHDVLDEANTMLRRGGLIAASGGGGTGNSGLGRRFRAHLGDVPSPPGASSRQEINDALSDRGFEHVETIRIVRDVSQTPRAFIDRLENNPFAWHPSVTQGALAAAAETTRNEAAASGIDLDTPSTFPAGVNLDLFRRACD